MTRARTTTGHRHRIVYEYVVENDMTKIHAVCICRGLKVPPRFDRLAAEEDGRQHMETYAKQSMGRPKGEKLP